MSVFAEFHAPVTVYPLSKILSAHPSASIDVDAIVPTGGSSHYVWVNTEAFDAIVRDLESTPGVGDVAVLDELADRALVRFEWETADSPVFDLVRSVGGRIAGARGTAEGWTLRIRFPNEDALRTFSERSREQSLDVTVDQLFDPETPFIDDRYGLSQKQRETLEVAYDLGYFEIPRRAKLADIADVLQISEQGVSERLRRGLSAFLIAMLQEDAVMDAVDRSADDEDD